MKILLDECIDWRLKFDFVDHEIFSAQDMGWLGKKNGVLMKAASDEGFQVLLTIDKNLKFQQNLKNYNLTIIILVQYRSTLTYLKPLVPKIIAILGQVKPGEVYEIR